VKQLSLGVPLPQGRSAQDIGEPDGDGTRWVRPSEWNLLLHPELRMKVATPDGWHDATLVYLQTSRPKLVKKDGWYVQEQAAIVKDQMTGAEIEVTTLAGLRVPGSLVVDRGGE
jgi:hypothetical protein